jgi:anaerobic selenocysteine-containing dehydrogenase
MANKKETSNSRRDFLKAAGLGVGAAAVATSVLKAGEAEAKPVKAGQDEPLYQETEHVNKYYDLARI